MGEHAHEQLLCRPIPQEELPLGLDRAVASSPKQKGRAGSAVLAVGTGTKVDSVSTGGYFERYPRDRLLPLPGPIHSSWAADDAAERLEMADRAAALGEMSLANLWRANVTRQRSPYSNQEALRRMMAVIEKQAAVRSRCLTPVEPDLIIATLAEMPGLEGSIEASRVTLPAPIEQATIARRNELAWELARAGYSSPHDVIKLGGPSEHRFLVGQLSAIAGATSRVLRQVGYLQRVSRTGQTPHEPMTIERRLMLVVDALTGLAEACGSGPWSDLEALGLDTPLIREAWAEREAREPTPPAFARDLFEWEASRERPSPPRQ